MKWRWRDQYTILWRRSQLKGAETSLILRCLTRGTSALRKIIFNTFFQKECQCWTAASQNRFLRGRQIAYMIYDHFQATGAHDAAQGLWDLFNICLQNGAIQNFDARCDQISTRNKWVASRECLGWSVQNEVAGFRSTSRLCTIKNWIEMEVTPSYQRWRTTVRQRIGQTIRTRNFKTRNERFDTGALAESHKGRDVSAERKVEECCQWKATGQCSRGDSWSFTPGEASGNRRDHGHGSFSGQRTQSSFYFKNADPDWRIDALSKWQSKRSKSFRIERQKTVWRFSERVHETVMWFMAPSHLPE